MKKRNMTRNRQDRNNGRKAIYSKYFILSAACGVVLVASFFFAARQHFSSIDYSMQNSRLKKQVEDLESDKRRLTLAREISLSPMEIKKAAKKFGIFEIGDNAATKTAAQPAAQAVKATKSADSTGETIKLVQKTVQTSVIASVQRPKSVETTEKRDPMVRDRKVQTDRR